MTPKSPTVTSSPPLPNHNLIYQVCVPMVPYSLYSALLLTRAHRIYIRDAHQENKVTIP
ncbi:unnamed protein product [Coregonus sp. 'balchen']|nr:unnamed protein product [Coregonus sp. 'balchen']